MKVFHRLMAAGALAGGLFFARSEYERDCLVTDEYVIRSPKLKGEGKTFVFLTDLHDKEFGEDNKRLLAAVRQAKPDAVLVGGDMMVAKGQGDLTVSLKLLWALSREFPVYHGNGNHESRMCRETEVYGTKYREYRNALRKMGVVYLSNSHAAFGEDFVLYGLNIPQKYYMPFLPEMEPGFAEKALGEPDREKFSILLAHSPLPYKEYGSWGADLALCGHFHGGTIRLPVLGGVMTPQYQFFYPRCAGEFGLESGGRMIVGRGLGTHSVNIRFNNKPQVVVVKVKK